MNEINDTETEIQATSERAFLHRLGGDCNVPAGCYATIDQDMLNVRGVISSPDGKVLIKKSLDGSTTEAAKLGESVADMIIDDGGRKILQDLANS